MVVPYPSVDERRARELLAELEYMARAFLPAWSGATTEGDSGRALLQIAARLGEQVTSRLDKTPRRDAIAFFDALDIPPPVPAPAEVPLVFTLVPKRVSTVFAPTRVQAAGKSAEGEEVLFETESGLELTPARLEYLAAVDSLNDHIEEAPPGFLTIAPPELLPDYHVMTFSDEGSPVLQISPTEGLAEHDVLRVNETAYEIDKIDEDLFTLSDPLETAVQVGTEVSKITRFEGFSLRNLQKHEVYIGHGELLNLEQPSTITLVVSPPSAAERLRELDVRFELYGLKEEAEEPTWHALSLGSSHGAGIELQKTWQGPVEELEVNGRKARWIRLRLMSPVLGRVIEGTRISQALLRVASDSSNVSPLAEPDTEDTVVQPAGCPPLDETGGNGLVEGSQTIKQAFHNSAPLSLSTRFHPFGSAPQRFDSFYLAAPEALSKKKASVTFDIDLVHASIAVLSVAQTLDGCHRAYAIATNGALQRIDIDTDHGIQWRQLGHPGPVDIISDRQLMETDSLRLSANLTPQAIEVNAAPSRDLIVVRDKGNRFWAAVVTRRDNVAGLFYRCDWVPLPSLGNGCDIKDVVLLPDPFNNNGAALLFAANENGLHVLHLGQLGHASSSEWNIVGANEEGESPVYASVSRIRLLPVLKPAWPKVSSSLLVKLVLMDATGAIVEGRFSSDIKVVWKYLMPDGPGVNQFPVNHEIKPVATDLFDKGVIVYAVSKDQTLFAFKRGYYDRLDTLKMPNSDLTFCADTELLCIPGDADHGPVVLAFVETAANESAVLVWDSVPKHRSKIFNRPIPIALGARFSGILLPEVNGQELTLRPILNGISEKLFQRWVFYTELDPDAEANAPTEPTSWSAVPYERGYQNPELSWEYFDGKTWRRIETGFQDTTNNLIASGLISFEVPEDMSMAKVAGQEDYWIRARLIGGDYGRVKYIIETARQQDTQTHNFQFPGQRTNEPEIVVETTREPGIQTQTITVDTSELHPPEIQSIEACFDLKKCNFPDHVLVENNLHLLDQTQANRTASAEFELFEGAAALDADIQQRGRTLYLGFSRPFDVPSLNLYVDSEEQAQETELVFEVLARDGWRRLRLNDEDPTRGFHCRGLVRVNVDTPPRRANLLGSERYWLRVYPRGREGVWAPHLIGVYANAVMAVQAESLSQELLSSSLGEPNQSFYLSKTPVLADGLELRVRERLTEEEQAVLVAETGEHAVATYENIPGDWVFWTRVDSFIGLDGDTRVYRLDPATGQVRFGDGNNGRIPPGGRDGIRAVKYRSGGGRQGNLAHFSIDKLKSSIESVEALTNPIPAAGGVDALPIDQVIATAPARLRHRQQALMPVDIEAIVLSWSPDVVRARCLLPDEQDDRIRIVIARHRDEPRPQPSLAEREALTRYLCKRAWGALGVQDILVTGPVYAPVAVETSILADSADRASVLEKQATERLQKFLHPTGGGPGGGGWPFGRRIWPSDVLRALVGLEGLDRIEHVDIQALDGTHLEDLPSTALICAQETDIKVTVQVPEGGV